ncbi:hypothetical protein AA313_de0204512 [Arthrobotrys entomopaga]|nr:hypothetical protein AA313_de0204512 [Arthrobotrys entomopaga]
MGAVCRPGRQAGAGHRIQNSNIAISVHLKEDREHLSLCFQNQHAGHTSPCLFQDFPCPVSFALLYKRRAYSPYSFLFFFFLPFFEQGPPFKGIFMPSFFPWRYWLALLTAQSIPASERSALAIWPCHGASDNRQAKRRPGSTGGEGNVCVNT